MARAKREITETRGVTSQVPVNQVTEEQIRQRAYDLYLARGCEDGHDLEDWIEAEQSLKMERRAA